MKRLLILGFSNTGKSFLFNKLINKNLAIVNKIASYTNDIKNHCLIINNEEWEIFDSPSIEKIFITNFFYTSIENILKNPSTKIILLINSSSILKQDFSKFLIDVINKRIKLYIFLVGCDINDIDKDFYKFKDYFINKTKFSILNILDYLKKNEFGYKKFKISNLENDYDKIFIIGKPNSGKSTLFNLIIGKNKQYVSSFCNTTKEINKNFVNIKNNSFNIYDTPGGMLINNFNKYIKSGKIILYLLDITKNINLFDIKIINNIMKKNKFIIVLINKLDLLNSEEKSKFINTKNFQILKKILKNNIKLISLKNKVNIDHLFHLLKQISIVKKKFFSTSYINKILNKIKKKDIFLSNNINLKFAYYNEKDNIINIYTNKKILKKNILNYLNKFFAKKIFLNFKQLNIKIHENNKNKKC